MAGGYGKTRKGKRGDIKLPGQQRSSWERNLIRVFKYQREQGIITHFEYETVPLLFPGKSEDGRGNRKVILDFPNVAWEGELGLGLATPVHTDELDTWPAHWFEVKGRLSHGGRLDQLSDEILMELDRRKDKDSRIKLQRLKRHYPLLSTRTWVLGAAEYAAIEKRFKPLIPEWES